MVALESQEIWFKLTHDYGDLSICIKAMAVPLIWTLWYKEIHLIITGAVKPIDGVLQQAPSGDPGILVQAVYLCLGSVGFRTSMDEPGCA